MKAHDHRSLPSLTPPPSPSALCLQPFTGGLGSFKLYVLLGHFLASTNKKDLGALLKVYASSHVTRIL